MAPPKTARREVLNDFLEETPNPSVDVQLGQIELLSRTPDPDAEEEGMTDLGETASIPVRVGPELSASLKQKPTQFEAGVRGFGSGATAGYFDEGVGALESAFPSMDMTIGDAINWWRGGPFPKNLRDNHQGKTYQQARDEQRALMDVSQEAYPKTYFGGQVAGAVALNRALPGASAARGATLKQLMVEGAKSGAKQGAVTGLGMSRADLTDPSLENVGGAMMDSAEGSAWGAGFGAAGPVLAKGGEKLMEKGNQLISGAGQKSVKAAEQAQRAKDLKELAEYEAMVKRMNEEALRLDKTPAVPPAPPNVKRLMDERNAQALADKQAAAVRPAEGTMRPKVVDDRVVPQAPAAPSLAERMSAKLKAARAGIEDGSPETMTQAGRAMQAVGAPAGMAGQGMMTRAGRGVGQSMIGQGAASPELLMKTLVQNPEALGPYSGLLLESANKKNFLATHYLLMNSDPKYRELVSQLSE